MARPWILNVLGLREILDAAGVAMPQRQTVKFDTQTAIDDGQKTQVPTPSVGVVGPTGPTGPTGFEPPGPAGSGVLSDIDATVYRTGTAQTHNTTGAFGAVIVIGGGGGGGGTQVGQGSGAASSGGGAGGTVIRFYTSLPSSFTYTVGTGGAGGVIGSGGAAGNPSSVAHDAITLTGSPGNGASPGPADDFNVAERISDVPGSGGAATGGDINMPGESGQRGWYGTFTVGGRGGSSWLGPGAQPQLADARKDARDANGFGDGGAGAASLDETGDEEDGGAGAAGAVIVIEFD